ncbi:MAG: DUF2683 family protein [Nanoarchaeota archaeon]|nr:DUF2683 family protein [Nanoarchaeota archaeon]MBU1854379.1 DUF2683 family protein [Nanoarchaeota archaeon]
MVKALIEINNETNRILNIVKAKQGLKDKSHVIEFIVNKYQEEDFETTTLKYINDGDKWMLAEDIPDMDFYFSQIWLTCFVNEFTQPGGIAYKKCLGVYKRYNLLFYYGEKDSNDVAEHLVNKFVKNTSFINEVNENILAVADKISNFAKKIPERNLDQLSNKELLEICEEHDRLHTEYYQWCWIPVAMDMFHNNFTERLKNYLKEKGIEEDNVNKYLITLTQPRTKSLIQIEREEFLILALNIKKDTAQKELFEKLFKTFQEQDNAKFGYQTHTKEYEELLAEKAGSLIRNIKPELMKQIKAHYEKYFHVNHMWVGEAYTLEHYLKELVKLIGKKSDIKAIIKANEEELKKSTKEREELIKKLNLENEWKQLFLGFGDFMVTKIYRRFAQIYALYKMEFVLTEIGKRFDLTLKQTRYLLSEEYKELLIDGKDFKKELEEREQFCVLYGEKGRSVIYTGIKAKELAEDAKKIEIKNIVELKGQIGCLGKATGIVKKIIRPSDMSKMNEGDILVSIATDPDIVPAMKKAAAIVTEQGGVTSHAAIVARELGIPCVIGTKIATKVFKDGDLVEVDANKGIVRKL